MHRRLQPPGQALANSVHVKLKENGVDIVGTEGEASGEWVLVDAGDVVVHVMLPAVRDYYDIEALWGGENRRSARTPPARGARCKASPAPPSPVLTFTGACGPLPAGVPMKMTLLAVGSKMPRWVDDAFNEYARRLPREAALHLRKSNPKNAAAASPPKKAWPPNAPASRLPSPRSKLIVLDERGQDWTSVRLASEMKTWLESGDDICLVIGGADGLSPPSNNAPTCCCVSALTLPHGMVRVLLAEQLYRAVSILNNHPYHRGENLACSAHIGHLAAISWR